MYETVLKIWCGSMLCWIYADTRRLRGKNLEGLLFDIAGIFGTIVSGLLTLYEVFSK